ncbi:MAG TPA: DUF4252 domain-containing protein [Steroidobacteraceae bacterium]|nr:DUF4252 domain-containing protein [Steroidobacteraceae bacterium]
MNARRCAVVAASLLASGPCLAQPPALNLPSFANLQRDAVETVSVTLGPSVLEFAGQFIDGHDPQSAALRKALLGVRTVEVHSYRFKSDQSEAQADLEALRSQLVAPLWHQLVQVRNRDDGKNVDIYYALDNHTVTGLTILSTAARAFTLVNIMGAIDLDQVAALRRTFVPDEPSHGP